MTKLHVGVVGVGIGRQHIDAYHALSDQFEVVAICDLDEAKGKETAEHYQISRLFSDFTEFCHCDDLDVIDLCTPSYLHFSQTKEALAAGKHVICEKPIAGSLQAVDELIALERGSGKRVMPIYQYRFGHGVQKLQFLREQGLAEKTYLTTIETLWRRRAPYYSVPWRGKWDTEMGGALLTLAIHAHDILTYVLGPIKRVFARTTTRVNPIETEDCVSASLEMADGSLASLSVTTGSSQEISRHRFCFSGFSAESHTAPYRNTSEPWIFTGDTPEMVEKIDETLKDFAPLPEGFTGQFFRFYEALRHDAASPVTLHDARMSLELITALYSSSRTNQPVELPIGPNHPMYGGWLPSQHAAVSP